MNKIVSPLLPQMRGTYVTDLHSALQLLLDRNAIRLADDTERRAVYSGLVRDSGEQSYGEVTYRIVQRFQEQCRLEVTGHVDEQTAVAFNDALSRHTDSTLAPPAKSEEFEVRGAVRLSDGYPAAGVSVAAYDRDLRHEQPLGSCEADKSGAYRIGYSPAQFKKSEKGSADLVVKVTVSGVLVATSPIMFNAPARAVIDVTLPDDKCEPLTMFEKIELAVRPLLDGVEVYKLEEDQEHQDLSFLSGETCFEKSALARFALAHKLARQSIRPEFWFVLLGRSFFIYNETKSLADQLAALLDLSSSLDAGTVRKTVRRGLDLKEIPASFRDSIDSWVEAFLRFVAKHTVAAPKPTFIKSALDQAAVTDTMAQETVARLFNEHKGSTTDFVKALKDQSTLSQAAIADLHTSLTLGDLTRGDYSVVKMLKDEFGVRQPEHVSTLARRSEDDWIKLITAKHSAGAITLPIAVGSLPAGQKLPEAETYGRILNDRFSAAFPTASFAGGLERGLSDGKTEGLQHGGAILQLINRHPQFELATTSIDNFLKSETHADPGATANDDGFRLELKAAQRVFKLVPTFEATNALLAEGVHSAHQIYRMGKSEFVRRYSGKTGFTQASAKQAWNRAAETTATVATVVGDLLAYQHEGLPAALKPGTDALSSFPNWNNLFQSGDLCNCEDCRSVLSPAAYFADLLLFLRDRPSATPPDKAKDVLFRRRPDLGYLELDCDNALTPLPYVDVVCEVLEQAIAGGEEDIELVGLTAVPSGANAGKAAVAAALANAKIEVGADFTLTQVNAAKPNRWVVHGDSATYLLEKKATANFFAAILHNTKTGADELRAYPQYVNGKAYDKLKIATSPITLPFDLFAEEVRATFRKCNLQRWDLMRTLRGAAAPNNPTDGDIACEYFSISRATGTDESSQILVAAPSVAAQQAAWGEAGNALWLATVANVKRFLNKTGLSYDDLLALVDLKFINPSGDITIRHLDASCDTDKKVIDGLNAASGAVKLDCINRFLRLLRKLDGWKAWELDLVLRHPRIGATSGNPKLDETFLINLFYFGEVRKRLGVKASVEQVCVLFGNLNVETHFTEPFKSRSDSIYQEIFLNRRLIHPRDAAFAIDPASGDLTPGQSFIDPTNQPPAHEPIVLAALGISASDLDLLNKFVRASDGSLYVPAGTALDLANLSFLWRQSWLAHALKFKISDWQLMLKVLNQDFADFGGANPVIGCFADPKAAMTFLEQIDGLVQTGFTPDEIDWILAADRTTKSATKPPATDADAARFLTTLRVQLQGIQAEHSAEKYDFLTAVPPTDVDSLTTLATSLLQDLGRDDPGTQFFIATLRDEVSVDAAVDMTVAGWPPAFEFPPAIAAAIPIRFDKTASRLRFTGLMTPAQQTTLKTNPSLTSVTGLQTYIDAVDSLFNRPRLALKFYQPVFTAPLAVLPPEVIFSSLADMTFAKTISYDSEQHLLSFAGFLTADQKTALDALSTDPDYRTAVASIATQPQAITSPDTRVWLLDADLKFPLRDLNAPTNDHLAENLATASIKALKFLSDRLSADAVVAAVSGHLGLTAAQSEALLTTYALLPPDTLMGHLTGTFAATGGVVNYATLKTTFDAWFRATRVAAIWINWKVTFADLATLSALITKGKLLDVRKLPLDVSGQIASADDFARLGRLLRVRNALSEDGMTLFRVLGKLNTGGYADSTAFAADVALVHDAWPADEVQKLVDSWSPGKLDDYLVAENWERLRRAFYFLGNLNAGFDNAKAFGATTMASSGTAALRGLLRSKFGTETWLTISGEIQDALRERKRDALSAYILTFIAATNPPSHKWENTNDLYAYYLIDVEMCACQLTSRLVQGSGSIQLFVQRCFMGLEPNVVVKADGDDGDSAWRWWSWMSAYRAWRANREVFLWPENWIEPELRKENSPFFKDLRDELLQNDINSDSVETAFQNYLEKLDNVAQLEIAGFYQEDDADDTLVHVFGRTRGAEPHVYYYRRYDYVEWTPWEKVDLDIQGDFLVPALINKRMFLFWPTFTEIQDEQGNSSVSTPGADEAGVTVQKALKKLRLQMAVSEYRQKKWTPKRVSTQYVDSQSYVSDVLKHHFRFALNDRSDIDGRVSIQCDGYGLAADNKAALDANYYNLQIRFNVAFELTGCHGAPELSDLFNDLVFLLQPEPASTDGEPVYDKWIETANRSDAPNNDFTLENLSESNQGLAHYLRTIPILIQTPWLFSMSPAWQLSYLDKLGADGLELLAMWRDRAPVPAGTWLPFFYNDKKRTFFVLPGLYNQGSVSAKEHDGTTMLTGETWSYYPAIKKFFRQADEKAEGLAATWAKNFKFSTLSAADQQIYAVFFRKAFPEDVPPRLPPDPAYTDEQAEDFTRRFCMRLFHLYFSLLSMFFFQFRQFRFANFYHPFVCDFARLVYNPLKGIPALMSRETQLQDSGFSFKQNYQPTPWVIDPLSENSYPKENVDFTRDGAYSPYNWELFFHAPLLIANTLSRNQRFEEARDWYHFIFNPIGVESTIPGSSVMSKYWITKPFYQTTKDGYVQERIDSILGMLAGDKSVPGYTDDIKSQLEGQVKDWRNNPFDPHRIAIYRTVAYQKTAVMKYLDNLIAWGDYEFGQDTMESINQATQLYILAAEILGPRPMKIPPQAKPPVESFNELEANLDKFGNELIQMENLVPVLPGNTPGGPDPAPLPTLYFCIPHNAKLIGYWDTVADRLYKIRHCMNIEGVVRQLALFAPPIDPGALVKAVAGGVNISSALSDLGAPLPFYRFNVLLQKANEVCGDVKALGSALLAALEKKDGEAMARLRQTHELSLLKAIMTVRQQQLDEANDNVQAVQLSRNVIEEKRNYYRDYQKIIPGEQLSLDQQKTAYDHQNQAQSINIGASVLGYLPNLTFGASGFGGSPHVAVQWGTGNIISALQAAAGSETQLSAAANHIANRAATLAGYDRKFDDCKLQERVADRELDQINAQITAAQQRVTVAQQELANQQLQIDNAKEVDTFMHSKYTSQDLYEWQVGQISSIYFQSYKLAYDLAKRAERSFRFELGQQDTSYINFGYWDSLQKGLLAGEQLQYDLRRLEAAYLQQNRREFELTKHVSLARLDPLALTKLRETGRCFINLPEEIFDLDFPGHYFRRIKSVSLTLPCVVGPYTTPACTVRLLKSSIRINTAQGDNKYRRNTDDQDLPADDDRFVENNIPFKAIATSNGQNDGGVFELNIRDDRYLPFEGAGVISAWSIELFNDLASNNPDFGKPLRQFDYNTISDLILHIRYTSREDAGVFKNIAVDNLRDYLANAGPANLAARSVRLFDLRREFATQWERFLKPANPADGNVFELKLTPDRFFVLDAGKTLKISTIWILARCTSPGGYDIVMTPPLPSPPPVGSNKVTLTPSDEYGGLHFHENDVSGLAVQITDTDTPETWKLHVTNPDGKDLQGDSSGMELNDLYLGLAYVWE